MPEGDTVYLAGRRLDEAFRDRIITQSEFRLPSLATVHVTGRTVLNVASRGKHLLFRFDDLTTLHTHFRMDGSWHLYRDSDTWRGGPAHDIRVVLENHYRTAVGYRLHDVALLRTADENRLVGHLGPDICADDWNAELAFERLRAAGDRSIATALVDQRNIAGIGNIYRCETMFLVGLSPDTRVDSLNESELRATITTARTLLWRNRDRASQSTTGDERRAHYVYGRGRGHCYRCNTRIRVIAAHDTEPWRAPSNVGRERGSANEQKVFWCPTCQPSDRNSASPVRSDRR